MTTFTLRGLKTLSSDNGNDIFQGTATLKIVTSSPYAIQYEVLQQQPGDFANIDLSPATGDDYKVFLNGQAIGNSGVDFVGIGKATWGNNKSGVFLLLESNTPDGEASSVFQLAGDNPNVTSTASLNAFFDSVTGVTGRLTGAFAPGAAIELEDLTAFHSKTENDRLLANGFDGDLWGGRIINTGVGDDLVQGISPNEHFILGAGNDTGKGGSGSDTIEGNAGRDRILGESGGDRLLGGYGNDTVLGGSGNDTLRGGGHADRLDGMGGNDRLYGDTGNDTLMGGTGNDTMTGGAGADNFRFIKGWGADRVTDFANDVDTLVIDDVIGTVANALALARNITGGVVFDFDGGDVLTVMGVTKAQVADDIFLA